MKKNKLLILAALCGGAYFIFKDQITAAFSSSSTYKVPVAGSSSNSILGGITSLAGAVGKIFGGSATPAGNTVYGSPGYDPATDPSISWTNIGSGTPAGNIPLSFDPTVGATPGVDFGMGADE
jgi:hypothetical protein